MAPEHHCCCHCDCKCCPEKKKTEAVLKANITCPHCRRKIEKALKSLKGVETVAFDVGKHMITVNGGEFEGKDCLKKVVGTGKGAILWPEDDLKKMKEAAKKKKEEEEKKKKEKEEEEKKKKEKEEKKKKKAEEAKKKEEEEKKKKKEEEEKKKKEGGEKKEVKQPEVHVIYRYVDPPYFYNYPPECYGHDQYQYQYQCPSNNCALM